jgi:diketogulonate reductase-like aldo/keto reductase
LRACERSLELLGLDHVDLYLIHWPKPDTRKDTWRALERLAREGMTRSIGVSNYTIRHLEQLMATANTPPAVNQVEFHPFLYQRALLDFCKKNEIALEAYSPLTRGERLNAPVIRAIAHKHGASPAQVLIAWCLTLGTITIPKTVQRARLAENFESIQLKLDAEDMEQLCSLDEGLRICWNPDELP